MYICYPVCMSSAAIMSPNRYLVLSLHVLKKARDFSALLVETNHQNLFNRWQLEWKEGEGGGRIC